jgi:3-isopropylmalate dehydratase small subunit
VITGKNFGCGSSRQQAVDCFISLGIQGIVAESFGAIYERNAINAGFPVIICKTLNELDLSHGDIVKINLKTGHITNSTKNRSVFAEPMADVQLEIYCKGSLLA